MANAGILANQSQFTTAQALDGSTQLNVRNFAADGTAKDTSGQLNVNTVQPVTGQPNNWPSMDDPYNADFGDTDAYRDGTQYSATALAAGTADNELLNPRTLQQNGNDDELAYMSLQINPPVTQSAAQQNMPQAAQSSATQIISNYSRFFLEAVSEPEQEKFQVVETFTGYYAFFYGKRPPFYRYTGLLLNDSVYRWNNDLKYVYENFFRGTKATEFNGVVVISYDGRVVTGFPVGLTMNQEAANDKGVPFSIDVLVVSHTPSNLSPDVESLLASARQKINNLKAQTLLAQALSSSAGNAQHLSDVATNGITPPVSILGTNVSPSSLGAVNQSLANGTLGGA